MKTLKAKRATKLEYDKTYLVHVRIGEIITAKYTIQNSFISTCCGAITLFPAANL